MKIKLPEFDYSPYHKVYVGRESRYATATACAYVNASRLISAQFLSRKVYLHNTNDYQIISEISIPYYPDLIDYKNGICITSNFPTLGIADSVVTMMKVEDDKLIRIKHIGLGKTRIHGCRILDETKAYITDTANDKSIMLLDLITGKVITKFKDFRLFPKDLFIHGDKIIIVSSDSRPSRDPVNITYSKIYVFDKDLKHVIHEFDFNGQTDAITVSGNDIFVTLQGQHMVAHFILNESLVYAGNIVGYTFPHGISTHDGTICVTNYGDNTLEVSNIRELLTSERYISRI